MNNQNNSINKLAKNTIILTIGSFSSKILVILLVPFYTGVLSTEDYGIYDMSITTIQLLMPLVTINIIDSILRFALDRNNNFSSIRRIAQRYILIGIGIFSFGALLCSVSNIFPQYNNYIFFIILYFISYTLNSYFLQVSKSSDHIKTIAISGVIGTIVLTISCIFFLKFTNLGLFGFYIANILGQAIPALYYAVTLKNLNSNRKICFDKSLANRMRSYSVPLILTAIGWWVNSSSDKYIVTFLCGVAANGVLSISYKIPNILSVLSGIFNQAWQISAIQEYDNESKNEYYNKVISYIMSSTVVFGMLLIFFNRFISRLLFAKDFYEAWIFVPFLIVSSILNISSGLFAPILSAQYKTKPIAISSLVGIISNVILNFTLCYFMGVQGVTIATAISSFLICLIRYISLRKILSSKAIYRISIAIIFTVVLAILEILGSNYLYMIIPMLCGLIVLYKELVQVFNSLHNKLLNRFKRK